MSVFEEEYLVAKELIEEYGQTVSWTNFTGYATDPSKPWEVTAPTSVTYTPKVVFLPEKDSYNSRELRNEIQVGFEKVYLSPSNFIPSLQDTIVRGGETHSIRYIKELNPNGEKLLYVVGVQR